MTPQPEPVSGYRRLILVVEDEPLLRELIGNALERRGFEVVTAGSPSEARRAFRATDPDGVVMDVDLGPGPNGFDLAQTFLAGSPGVGIVFLTNLPDPRFAGRPGNDLPRGVAYLRKSGVHEIGRLADALDAVMRGAVDASMRHDRDPARPFATLTRRQIEVLRLVALGNTNAQIAEILGITTRSVGETVTRAFAALGMDGAPEGNLRVAAARRFVRVAGSPMEMPERGRPTP